MGLYVLTSPLVNTTSFYKEKKKQGTSERMGRPEVISIETFVNCTSAVP